MTPQPDTEHDDLDHLIHGCAGWPRFVAHVEHVWQAQFHRRVAEAMAGGEDSEAKLQRLAQAVAIKEELQALLSWPGRRVAEVAKARVASGATGPRRGGL